MSDIAAPGAAFEPPERTSFRVATTRNEQDSRPGSPYWAPSMPIVLSVRRCSSRSNGSTCAHTGIGNWGASIYLAAIQGTPGQQHWHASPVLFVGRAVLGYQVSFFELNRHHDIRSSEREHEMRQNHLRRHPECKQEAEVQRMAYDAIRQWRPERERRVRFADQRQPDLAKPNRSKWLM